MSLFIRGFISNVLERKGSLSNYAHDQYEDTKNETDFSFLPIHYLKHYKQTKITDMPHPNY